MDTPSSPERPDAALADAVINRTLGALSADLAPFWLAAIVESASDAIISKTLEGVITSWNQGAERLYGYTAEEVIGQPVTMLIPPDHVDEEPEILARLRHGERIEHYETVRVKKTGERVDVSLSVSPIRGPGGTLIGASKVARDISERKRHEAQLQQALQDAEAARHQAEEASRLKDEFLAVVSHELRTPLTAMLGWVRLLQDGGLDEERSARALDTIDRNVRAQAQLIEDLLDVSRIVTGKMHLEMKPVSLGTVIHAAVDSIMPTAESKGVRLQIVLDPRPNNVMGDYERLLQVMWNLLANAVKFTSRGDRIEIHLEQVNPADHAGDAGGAADSQALIRIVDTGKGISPAFLSAVFDRFTQQDSSSTRAHGGMGMGLSIVKYLVEMHGGSVGAASAGEGQGATFSVWLPLLCENRATPGSYYRQDTSHQAIEAPMHPELVGLSLLVVDDEADTRDMIAAAFEQSGAVVRCEKSGAAALTALDQWLPDIMILDINMPEMDGYGLIRAIRARPAASGGRIPAVALTAMVRIEDRVKSLAAGFQMHVAKPAEISELRAIVASLASVVTRK